ncbi:MAG TPA: hypothetical protein VK638_37900 [Edaphobacter sp.]|nr:hypothetical protein [Edaphobacter sp.]
MIDGKIKGYNWHEYVGQSPDDLIADLVILVVTSLHLGASTEGAGKLSEEDTNIVTEHTGVPALKRKRQGSWLIGLTSFLFILLQSACTAVMAISGLRLLIGLGSLAAASFIPGFIFSIHTDKIRLPMMAVAVLGSVLNLYVVWRIRSLRARPASQWRAQPVTAKQRRSETIQIVLSILTLFLVVAEILAHHVLHGSFL